MFLFLLFLTHFFRRLQTEIFETFPHDVTLLEKEALPEALIATYYAPSLVMWKENKNSSGDEIANVNFLRRYGTYVLQNTKKENLLRLTN